MPLLIGTQKVDESTGRGGFIGVYLVNGTDRDALPAFDTGIRCFGEIKNLFYWFAHVSS